MPKHETIDVMESILFVNITGRNVYTYTPEKELRELERIAAEQFGLNRIAAMRHVVKSAYYN